jgi:glycosyltransferase involved in cell wall biosynthesis
MRIAWTGEAGSPGAGGVKGIAHLMLVRLAERGHEIEVFGSSETRRLLGELPTNIHVIAQPVRWQWSRWYNRGQLRLFLSSSVMRIRLQRRLARALEERHAERPFDVIFQMSQLESFFRKRPPEGPPLVVHPCTIARVEWEWHRAERDLIPHTSEAKFRFVSLLLGIRAALQRPHARSPTIIVGPSRVFLADLQRVFGLSSERLAMLRHPVDLDEIRPGPSSHESPDKLRLLFVSRMSSRKGLELIVALSHRLDDLGDRVEIELIGGATLWSDYSALLAGLNPRTATYRGEVPHAEVQHLLRTSAALLVPSRFEPGSIVTGEALASGLPVVLSTAVGPSDVISGSAGRVFCDGDIDAFETATRDLLDEIERDATGVREAARAAAERYFDADTVVDELERILTFASRQEERA